MNGLAEQHLLTLPCSRETRSLVAPNDQDICPTDFACQLNWQKSLIVIPGLRDARMVAQEPSPVAGAAEGL